ncbi:hypothetical protein [Chitinophaga pinensis]|uniref:hypothetical protein n=1 Tax=Chitinophaga pinensis TaxID=79329 RepID=UPI001C9A2A1B|nr:hypothetical protein [Chitinophaga pinensis]
MKDYHYIDLKQPITEQLFTMKNRNQYGTTFVKIKKGKETAALAHIAAVYKKYFPLSPYDIPL